MSTVAAYVRERFRVARFGPICLLLAAAAAWSAGGATMSLLPITFLLGAVLLLQFRLWDDLEDRSRDRHTHPTRVLVNAPAEPFRRVLAVLAVGAIALSARQPNAFAATLALNVAFWCAYRIVRPRVSPNSWRFGLLLGKYPGFVGVMALSLGDVDSARLGMAATAAYLCASGYELLHDSPARVGGTS